MKVTIGDLSGVKAAWKAGSSLKAVYSMWGQADESDLTPGPVLDEWEMGKTPKEKLGNRGLSFMTGGLFTVSTDCKHWRNKFATRPLIFLHCLVLVS